MMAMLVAGLTAGQLPPGFQLFNGCEPVRVVYDVGDEVEDAGLTAARVRDLVESRLRAARLYRSEGSGEVLLVQVRVVGRAFSFSLRFMKFVYDVESESVGPATTWSDGRFGTYLTGDEADKAFVMQGLSELVDRFILVFLRANEDACE